MTLAFPKPSRPVRGTSEAKRHMALVAQLPCVCCGRFAVHVHHCIHGRFSQTKASDFDTIPLCREHHDDLHQRGRLWRATYGDDTDYLLSTRAAVERLKRDIIGG